MGRLRIPMVVKFSLLAHSVAHDFFPHDFMHIWYSVLQVGPA